MTWVAHWITLDIPLVGYLRALPSEAVYVVAVLESDRQADLERGLQVLTVDDRRQATKRAAADIIVTGRDRGIMVNDDGTVKEDIMSSWESARGETARLAWWVRPAILGVAFVVGLLVGYALP